MKHDYSKAIGIVAIWLSIAFIAFIAPEHIVDVVAYGVGASFIVGFFL